MQKLKSKLKSGATSIYVVVIATLLFGVITVSFIRIIINEANRTTNDELAQSAYDSALAGVEDAKVALKKYYECTQAGDSTEDAVCNNVVNQIRSALGNTDLGVQTDNDGNVTKADVNCDAVAKALQRNGDATTGGEVKIKETSSANYTTVQAYTCVSLNDTLGDYRSTLSSGSTVKVVPLKTNDEAGVAAVKALKISWFSQIDGTTYNYGDTHNKNGNLYPTSSTNNGVYFSPLETASTPPTISAQVIQTSSQFKLADLDSTIGSQTDRATVFLVPTDPTDSAGTSTVSAQTLLDSNNHSKTKSPIKVTCGANDSAEFACSAILVLPEPVGGDRIADTFFLVLSLPYGTPQTQFSVNLCKNESCSSLANFSGVQVSIDSTGRANDMYSRVEARVEFSDTSFPFPEFAIQATANDGEAIKKNFYVTSDCYTLTDNNGTQSWHAESCSNADEVKD